MGSVMNQLRILYNLIERSKGFAFDFEAVDRVTGKPTIDRKSVV